MSPASGRASSPVVLCEEQSSSLFVLRHTASARLKPWLPRMSKLVPTVLLGASSCVSASSPARVVRGSRVLCMRLWRTAVLPMFPSTQRGCPFPINAGHTRRPVPTPRPLRIFAPNKTSRNSREDDRLVRRRRPRGRSCSGSIRTSQSCRRLLPLTGRVYLSDQMTQWASRPQSMPSPKQ